jgi:high mobility group protein B1
MNQQFYMPPQMMQNNNIIVNHNQQMDSKKMTKTKAGKDGKPKGRMSSYTFFVQTCREEHRKKHPNENVNFTEFSKKCAERWKQMTDKEKKRFSEMADKDKQRFDKEMSSYTPPVGESSGRGKRKKKDPNAPKRPLSAFFLFCQDERPAVKELHPSYSVGDVAKDLGEKWNKILPENKHKYELKAQQAKGEYEKVMQVYKNKGDALAADAADDDDDEEEEDDE